MNKKMLFAYLLTTVIILTLSIIGFIVKNFTLAGITLFMFLVYLFVIILVYELAEELSFTIKENNLLYPLSSNKKCIVPIKDIGEIYITHFKYHDNLSVKLKSGKVINGFYIFILNNLYKENSNKLIKTFKSINENIKLTESQGKDTSFFTFWILSLLAGGGGGGSN